MPTALSKPILLLSGTPASGKDTVSAELIKLDSRFKHFRKHRGSDTAKGNDTYVHVEPDEFAQLASNGAFVQYHQRYGRGYGVSFDELERHWARGEIPIIHVGKYENIAPFIRDDLTVTSILLLVDKSETERRLVERHPNDEAEVMKRLSAYQEERDELAHLVKSGLPLNFHVVLDNSGNAPEKTAEQIALLYQS